MLVFATSDKGGTRPIGHLLQHRVPNRHAGPRHVLSGFDFGSPTAGAIFSIPTALRDVARSGPHSYLAGSNRVVSLDVWREIDSVRGRPDGAGRLVLFPGDIGGGEFAPDAETVQRCARLLLRMDEEFPLVLIDLSAARSHALDTALAAAALPRMRRVNCRWLVFHRWTRQHIVAASGMVFEENGIVAIGSDRGLDRNELARNIRFVRTAVVDPDSPDLSGLRPEQVEWLRTCNMTLQSLASELKVGRVNTLGDVPMDPVLHWREQLITDHDALGIEVANPATVEAFNLLARRLTEDEA